MDRRSLRYIVFISNILLVFKVYSFQVESNWNRFFKKEVIIKCAFAESICQDFCGKQESCTVKEGSCRDGVGTSICATNLFPNLGKTIVPTEEQVPIEEFWDFLKKGLFVSVDSKSVYNHIYAYDDPELQAKFQKICRQEENHYPVLFIRIKDPFSRIMDKARYLVCNDPQETIIYRMGDSAEWVEVNE